MSGLRLAILGPGNLGLALAQWAAERGLSVSLAGRTQEHASRGLDRVLRRWEGSVRKGRLESRDAEEAQGRLEATSLEAALSTCEVFVEALPESLDLKAEAWRSLTPAARPEVLWGTASSSLPVHALRRASGFPQPILGLHCFVPLQHHRVMELVAEPGAPLPRALAFAQALDLRVVQAPDQVGYLASRLALLQGLEAMRMVEQGVAAAPEIDALMALGYGQPCGPLELSDRVGLDLRLAIAEAVHAATANPAFAPPAILRELVSQGRLGLKTGRGFYHWFEGKPLP